MQPSADRSPTRAVPRRRLLGRALVILVSTDATGVAALFATAALLRADGHPHAASGTLIVALTGLAGVLLALIAIPAAVRSLPDARRAIRATTRATVLVAAGLVVNTVGTVGVLAAYDGSGRVEAAGLLLLVGGDVLSVLYLVVLRTAHRAARAASA